MSTSIASHLPRCRCCSGTTSRLFPVSMDERQRRELWCRACIERREWNLAAGAYAAVCQVAHVREGLARHPAPVWFAQARLHLPRIEAVLAVEAARKAGIYERDLVDYGVALLQLGLDDRRDDWRLAVALGRAVGRRLLGQARRELAAPGPELCLGGCVCICRHACDDHYGPCEECACEHLDVVPELTGFGFAKLRREAR